MLAILGGFAASFRRLKITIMRSLHGKVRVHVNLADSCRRQFLLG